MASDDPDFERKAADVIGLYVNPPQHAAVFCVDEKTAIQTLDRLDPVLPLSPRRAERHGFEYYRHGTLSLYAALNTKAARSWVRPRPTIPPKSLWLSWARLLRCNPGVARSTLSPTTSRPIRPSGSHSSWPCIPTGTWVLLGPFPRG